MFCTTAAETCCHCLLCCMVLPVAISCLVIGNEYANDTVCTDGDFSVDLDTFLIVAGVSQLAAIALLFCLRICCSEGMCEYDEDEYAFKCNVSLCIFSFWFLFDIIWAVVGMVIYCNEMNDDCRDESIGIMILSWSIIQFVFCVLSCIVAVITLAAMVGGMIGRTVGFC